MENHKNYREKSSNSKGIIFLIQKIYQNRGEIAIFYTVGAIGLFINFFVSLYFFNNFHLDHLHSNILGIIASISSNFILNKIWTFNDRNIKYDIVVKQFLKYSLFNSVGVLIQLSIVYGLGKTTIDFSWIIIIAISIASILNYIVNKKFIFKNKEILNIKNKFGIK